MFYKKKEKTKDKEYSMIGKTKSSLRFLRPVVGLGFFWVVRPVLGFIYLEDQMGTVLK